MVVLNKQNNHKARKRNRVTGKEQDHVQVQKVPHPWNARGANMRSKVYHMDQK